MFDEGWRKWSGVHCVQSKLNKGFRCFADVSRGNNPLRFWMLEKITHKTAWQRLLFRAGIPDTFSCATIHSQPTLWIHQLKLFLTGWNAELFTSAASDGVASGLLPPQRIPSSQPVYSSKLCQGQGSMPCCTQTMFLRAEADLTCKWTHNEFVYSARE